VYFSILNQPFLFRFEPGSDTVSRYAEEGLNGAVPSALAFNPQGELYLTARSQPGVKPILLLDALGYDYRQIGEFMQPNADADWSEGGFVQPTAIQTEDFGQFLFVSDYTADYAYLTCYQLFSMDELGN